MDKPQPPHQEQQTQPSKSSEAAASQSSQPDQPKASSQDSKTPEISGPKSTLDAVTAALQAEATEQSSSQADEVQTGAPEDKDADTPDATEDAEEAQDTEAKDAEEAQDAEAKGGEDTADSEPDSQDDFATPPGKERSVQRWNKLVERVKQGEALAGVLRNIGAPREELAHHLETLTLAYRGGQEGRKQALVRLDALRAALARDLGIEVAGVDLLTDYPDLAKQVEELTLSREHALEIANARRLRQRFEEQTRTAAQQQQQSAQRQQEEQAAASALDALGARLEASDVDYQAKVKILQENGDIADIMQNFSPQQWAAQFERRYNLLARPTSKPKPAADQPLRAPGAAGGGKPAPKSMLEAVQLGLSQSES